MATRLRRTATRITGASEAARLALTLGAEARAARRARRLTLDQVARRTGISRTRLSEIERGRGIGAPIETWITLCIVLERPLAVSFSRPLGTPRAPADAAHLAIQEHVLALARANGRQGTFELPTRPTDPSRSTDVGIRDDERRQRILAECWNSIGDLGAAARATHRKAAEAAATWPDDRIATVWVVRASATNRQMMASYPQIIAAAFPGSSRSWVAALAHGTEPPAEPGLVWFDPATRRLTEHRRATMPG